jgi:DNA-directed RNA polymerase specialized sigma24 family protein
VDPPGAEARRGGGVHPARADGRRGDRRLSVDLDSELDGIVAGDPDAFGRWVAGAEPPLRASLRPLAARVDCEAVLQEALLRIWQVAPRCRRDERPNALLRFGLRIARNLAIDELRRARLSPTEAGALEAALARADAVEPRAPADPLLRRAIEECRRALPDKPAAALEARLESAGGEPDQLLAARLRMKLNTFLQNVTRARKLMAACLQKHGVDLEELT